MNNNNDNRGNPEMMNVTLPPDLLEELDAQCAEFGLSRTEAIQDAANGRPRIARHY